MAVSGARRTAFLLLQCFTAEATAIFPPVARAKTLISATIRIQWWQHDASVRMAVFQAVIETMYSYCSGRPGWTVPDDLPPWPESGAWTRRWVRRNRREEAKSV